MFTTSLLLALGALSLLSPASAQTWTYCNPLNATCAGDMALGTASTFNFTNQTSTDATIWNATAGTLTYDNQGAMFTIAKRFDSPTIQSNFYIFFGTIEVIMKAASGQGIISSIVLESDDLDEIDWELMGGNTTHAETNYFGKGNTTSYNRAIYYPVDEPQQNFHNYTVVWSAEKIDWLIDGAVVRTLLYDDANGGATFPQTPMTVRLGIWAGGDPSLPNGTIEWAGGVTEYADVPYTMRVASIRVLDASNGSLYTYGDHSGSYESIKTTPGISPLATYLKNPHPLNSTTSPNNTNSTTTSPLAAPIQKFEGLSRGAQIGIIVGAASAAAILFGLLTWCCCRQRKAGRHEKEIADFEFRKNEEELMQYRSMMSQGRGYVQVPERAATPVGVGRSPLGKEGW